jgi:hypothetical protein
MKRLLVAEEWDRFARTVLHSHVPPALRREMRRAFYAGAAAMLGIIGKFEDVPTGVDTMHGLHQELNHFVDEVKELRS